MSWNILEVGKITQKLLMNRVIRFGGIILCVLILIGIQYRLVCAATRRVCKTSRLLPNPGESASKKTNGVNEGEQGKSITICPRHAHLQQPAEIPRSVMVGGSFSVYLTSYNVRPKDVRPPIKLSLRPTIQLRYEDKLFRSLIPKHGPPKFQTVDLTVRDRAP